MSAGIIKNSKILLDKPAEFCYYNQAPRERHLAGQTEQHFHGGIAQQGERLNGIQEVSGSIPLISTKERKRLRNISGAFSLLKRRAERGGSFGSGAFEFYCLQI